MGTLHSLAISRSHHKVARRFMLENDLPDTKTAIVKMIEMASAAHSSESREGGAEQRHGRDPVPREDR